MHAEAVPEAAEENKSVTKGSGAWVTAPTRSGGGSQQLNNSLKPRHTTGIFDPGTQLGPAADPGGGASMDT